MLACCNAAEYVIPFVISDRKSKKPEMCDGEIPETMYGMSDFGWINGELFDKWFHYHMLQPLDLFSYCWMASHLSLPHLLLGKQLRKKLLSSAYHLTLPMKPSLWTKDHLGNFCMIIRKKLLADLHFPRYLVKSGERLCAWITGFDAWVFIWLIEIS